MPLFPANIGREYAHEMHMVDENLIDYNGRWEGPHDVFGTYFTIRPSSDYREVTFRPISGHGQEEVQRIALKATLAKGSQVLFRATVYTSGEIAIAFAGVRSRDVSLSRAPYVSAEIRANQQMEFEHNWSRGHPVERLLTIVEREVEYFIIGLRGVGTGYNTTDAYLNLSNFEIIRADSPTTVDPAFTLSASSASGYRRSRFQNVQHQSAFEHALQVTATDTKTHAPVTSGEVTFAVTSGPGGAYFSTDSTSTWNAVSGKAVVLDTVPIAGGTATAHTPWGYRSRI